MPSTSWRVSSVADSIGPKADPSGNVDLIILNLTSESFLSFSPIAQRLLCPNMKFRQLVNRFGKTKEQM